MSNVFENKGALAATIVVAASNSLNKGQANYICDGVNDHVEIQAALDALPATGGEVLLLDGTYHIEVGLVLDSYQTLRGCGRNTILTTTTANTDIITATGGSGTEKTGIIISDLQIDGADVSDCGIYFNYIDHSLIQNVYSRRHTSGGYLRGIYLKNSDFNTITGNFCQGNGHEGIDLNLANNNTIMGNNCQGNSFAGIALYSANNNTIMGNNCQGNINEGIYLASANNNTIVGNTCQGTSKEGIYLYEANNNTIMGNICLENSQGTTNTKDDIYLQASDYNNIQGNTCRSPTIGTTLTVGELVGAADIHVTDTAGFKVGLGVVIDLGGGNEEYHRISAITAGAPGIITIDAPLANNQGAGETINVPSVRYGINIATANCDKNLVIGNDLFDDGFGTAPFNDAGTGTKLNVYVVPFVSGTDPQDSGFLINAGAEFARALLRLPPRVTQVVRMKVYARSTITEADRMRAFFAVYGGADNEPYNTHDGSVDNHPSTSVNFALNDIIYWTLTTAGVLALVSGDSIQVVVLYKAAGNGDCATSAYLRTVEIEYV